MTVRSSHIEKQKSTRCWSTLMTWRFCLVSALSVPDIHVYSFIFCNLPLSKLMFSPTGFMHHHTTVSYPFLWFLFCLPCATIFHREPKEILYITCTEYSGTYDSCIPDPQRLEDMWCSTTFFAKYMRPHGQGTNKTFLSSHMDRQTHVGGFYKSRVTCSLSCVRPRVAHNTRSNFVSISCLIVSRPYLCRSFPLEDK